MPKYELYLSSKMSWDGCLNMGLNNNGFQMENQKFRVMAFCLRVMEQRRWEDVVNKTQTQPKANVVSLLSGLQISQRNREIMNRM